MNADNRREQVTIRLPADLDERLRRVAAKQVRTKSNLIEYLITSGIEALEAELPKTER